jgi:hypothetical protein
MEEAPKNGKVSHSVHANGMNEWMNEWLVLGTAVNTADMQSGQWHIIGLKNKYCYLQHPVFYRLISKVHQYYVQVQYTVFLNLLSKY